MASFLLSLYCFQLDEGLAITRTIHGPFGFNERFEAENTAFAELHFDDHTLPFQGGEISHT